MFGGFALLDVLFTTYALTHLGAFEANPIARFLWQNGGFVSLLSGKILLALLIGLLWEVEEKKGRLALRLCATIQIGVVTLTSMVHLASLHFS